MDRWKYFDITHRDHVLCNPTSLAKLQEIIEILALPDGTRVLDIACGKAESLVRLVERYGCSAVGVDASPYFIREARERAAGRASNAGIDFHEVDGAKYDGSPESFDVVMCLGASWIWQGHLGTLKALAREAGRTDSGWRTVLAPGTGGSVFKSTGSSSRNVRNPLRERPDWNPRRFNAALLDSQ
jgi:SAM-dependent methyltransferase